MHIDEMSLEAAPLNSPFVNLKSMTGVPEGLDKQSDINICDSLLDVVMVRHEQPTIREIFRRINKGMFVMNPDFQRDFVWGQDTQSRFIESILMRIPLPVFYFAECLDGKIIVVDGLQRLTTVTRYLSNEFPLRINGADSSEFQGKLFKDLSIKLQNRIEDTQLIIYILDEKIPERAKLDIFERVNAGTPLTRQQMRNSLYMGQATALLKNLSQSHAFILATGNSLDKKSMRDREIINRFMAFSIWALITIKEKWINSSPQHSKR
ncbi:MAG: DUF262 domain-containing protein [Desulfovibrio sp.]|jgi:hypothetical protein|nr:DUF262 domain-containing protein [Desulfovibrio sp.]